MHVIIYTVRWPFKTGGRRYAFIFYVRICMYMRLFQGELPSVDVTIEEGKTTVKQTNTVEVNDKCGNYLHI